MASVQQSTPTMSRKQEANAHGLPREGQPLLYRRRKQVIPRQPQVAPQVTWTTITPIPGDRPTLFPIPSRSPTMSRTRRGSQRGGHSVPRSRVTGPQRLSVSDLPPLHGPQLTLAPPRQLSPQVQSAASASVHLPHLPAAAASWFSPRGTALAVGPVARGQQEMVAPLPRCTPAAGGAWETPSLAKRTKGLWHGSATRQSHHLPPVQPTKNVQICTGTQLAWKHLGHSETEELIKVQVGHGGNTCSDLFTGLGPYLRANRSIQSTLRTPKGLSAHQEGQGIHRPAKQTVHRKQSCPEDEEALVRRLRKKRKELEELEDKVYEEMFKTIFSSLHEKESPMRSKCILSDASSLTLDPAAGHLVPQSTCSVTNDATGETQTCSELVSLDQLLAELCPVSDNLLSHNARVKDSSGETENHAEIAHPDLLEGLCSVSADSLSSAFLDELLEMWEEEELLDRAAAGESDSEPESLLSLPLQEEEAEPPASPMDSNPCMEQHSQPLPSPLLEAPNMSVGCALATDPAAEAEAAGMEAEHAQAAPPQEKPCGDEPLAGACPVPAQPLARSVPACPAGSAAVPQPPAPRPWHSMAKTARRALRPLLSFSCLRGQPEE